MISTLDELKYEHDPGWRPLCTPGAFETAVNVAVSIAAMEFDVRLTTKQGVDVDLEDCDRVGPYMVLVRPADWPALRDVLDEIIDEQTEFDSWIERRERTVGRAQRAMIVSLVFIVTVLTLSGLIEL